MARLKEHAIVVIGASSGGVEALIQIMHGLPVDLPAAICVVLHVSPATSTLPQILSRYGPLPAAHAEDGEALQPGRVYVAPPDRHLLVKRGQLLVTRGPRENRVRPAIDPLFRSAAVAYGARGGGVVWSGALDAGTGGLLGIKRCGGVAVVQDPRDALIPGMPRSALRFVAVDHCLPLVEIPALLRRLAQELTADGAAVPAVPDRDREIDYGMRI